MALKTLEKQQREIVQGKREYDKRYFPRWKVNKPVLYREAGGATFRSYTKDLSLEGATIMVFGNPPARQRVQLRIYLAEQEDFEVQGRVAWSKLELNHKMLGIIFENLSPKAQKLIMQHAVVLTEADLFIEGLIRNLNLIMNFSSKRSLRPHHGPPLRQQHVPAGWPERRDVCDSWRTGGPLWLWKERGKR